MQVADCVSGFRVVSFRGISVSDLPFDCQTFERIQHLTLAARGV